jgi:polyisoprenyl-phosphate glycosyltransferase
VRELGLLSVIAPVYNERETIAEFRERVDSALWDIPYELLLVDDGSTDGSTAILERMAAEDRRVRVISFSRNFGHQAALTAGLDHATGDAVVMVDSDLQDPPEVILEMLLRWRNGADVVSAVREERPGEGRLKLLTARWFYRVFAKLAQIDFAQNAGDFRLLDRRAVEALAAMPERTRFLRGMSAWVGFRQESVGYRRDPRRAGTTKYTPRRTVRFALDAISSFTHVPLQLATVLGFVFSTVAFIAIPVAIGFRIAGQFVPGITTVLLVVLLLGGIQLITVGIIGEYLGRVYDEVKQRPLYVVERRLNVSPPPAVEEGRRHTIEA